MSKLVRIVASIGLVVLALGVFLYSTQFPAESALDELANVVSAFLVTLAVFVHQYPKARARGRSGDVTGAATSVTDTRSEARRNE